MHNKRYDCVLSLTACHRLGAAILPIAEYEGRVFSLEVPGERDVGAFSKQRAKNDHGMPANLLAGCTTGVSRVE